MAARFNFSAVARDLCRKFPEATTATLCRKLQKVTGNVKTEEQCRNIIRYVRGQAGDRTRKVLKKNGLDDTFHKTKTLALKMPPSMAKAWEPFVLEGANRVGILSDIHFPYHDEAALSTAVKHLKKMKPTAILLNGDLGDWYTISRYLKNPAQRNMASELATQRNGLGWLRSEFPNARFIFKKGNHDERWDHWLWNNAPEISDQPEMRLATWLHCDKYNIEVVGEQRPVMLGKLPCLHGHELPKGLTNPVNMARGAFLRTIHTVLVGHGHRTSTHVETDMWHKEITCWSVGCLCELTPEYSRINRYNHGFAFVEVASDGTFDVMNYRITDGVVRG